MMDPTKSCFILVGWDKSFSFLLLGHSGSNFGFLLFLGSECQCCSLAGI